MPVHVTFMIGCTACGKSAVGYELALQLDAEIVVADSMKIYRRMDIGTAKPALAMRQLVPYHMIDVVEPTESFNVAEYVERADRVVAEIHTRGRPILVIGGTALYVMSLAYGLFEGPGPDPEFRTTLRERASRGGVAALHAELQRVDPLAAQRIHPNDYRRIERALEVFQSGGVPISTLQTQWAQGRGRFACNFIGLRREKSDQNRRINARVRHMIEAGLVGEVRGLLAQATQLSAQASQAVGYAEVLAHLQGRCSLEDAIEDIKIKTRRLAKQQRTWFRRFPDVRWFDVAETFKTQDVLNPILATIR